MRRVQVLGFVDDNVVVACPVLPLGELGGVGGELEKGSLLAEFSRDQLDHLPHLGPLGPVQPHTTARSWRVEIVGPRFDTAGEHDLLPLVADETGWEFESDCGARVSEHAIQLLVLRRVGASARVGLAQQPGRELVDSEDLDTIGDFGAGEVAQ